MDLENPGGEQLQSFQWYPGHMAKTKRILAENLKLVDIVIEIVDARAPFSGKNPDINELARNKPHLIVLNKADLADDFMTREWAAYFARAGTRAVAAESVRGKGIKEVMAAAKELTRERVEAQKKRGRLFVPLRAMIVGIPNSGKSTFINKFVGKNAARAADKPGVTKGKQWIRINHGFELMDTPGILWPKFEDQETGKKLAFTGAIADNIMDLPLLSFDLIKFLRVSYPNALKKRYGVEVLPAETDVEVLFKIAEARGFLIKNGEVDLARMASVFIDEFRAGLLGKITLDRPALMACS